MMGSLMKTKILFVLVHLAFLLTLTHVSFAEEKDLIAGSSASQHAVRIMSIFETEERIVTGYGLGIPVLVNGKPMILTALHEVKDPKIEASDILVNLEDGWIKCKIVSQDQDYDLAIIEPRLKPSFVLEISTEETKEGDTVLNPNYFKDHKLILKPGKVGKHLEVLWLADIEGFSHGSSGSPILDKQGRIVGIGIAGLSNDNGKTMFKAIFVGVDKINAFIKATEVVLKVKDWITKILETNKYVHLPMKKPKK